MKHTKPFSSLNKEDAHIAGGKGASLGEMFQAGIPVPDGYVVTAESFEYFLKETDLKQEIEAILSHVDTQAIHTVEKASEEIQNLILSSEMPQEIQKELFQHYEEKDMHYVAVRSSATAEDGADHAWAGQLDSFLNTTKENLEENVKKCWASLFTPRAIFYRYEKGLHTTHISVAVVIQKMINSEKSGIAFSVHPVTEDRNQIIIESGFGLGEAIVSGSVTPDSYVITKEPHEIIDINVNTQNKALYRSTEKTEHGYNIWKELSDTEANKQVLSETEILELSKIIQKVENHYGFPVDTEWAQEGGKFYIVQSRPITTLKPISHKDNQVDFDLNTEHMVWGPVAMKSIMLFSTCFKGLFEYFPKEYPGYSWPKLLALFSANNEKKFAWIHQKKEIENNGSKLFLDYMLDDKKREITRDKWIKSCTELHAFEKNIEVLKLSDLNIDELIYHWNSFQNLIDNFWTWSSLPELANFGSVHVLEKKLKGLIPQNEIMNVLEILTSPEESSFYQEEEIDLSRTTDFENHKKKYFWLRNGYTGIKVLPASYFKLRKEKIEKDFETKIKKRFETIKKQKIEIIQKYILSPEIVKISENIIDGIVWQDKRKKEVWIYIHYMDLLLDEISIRTKLKKEDIKLLFPFEVEKLLKQEIILSDFIDRKKGLTLFINSNGSFFTFDFQRTNTYWNKFFNQKVDQDVELKGIIASKGGRGITTGKIKIILSPENFSNFESGDILVTTMTTPEYVILMKEASVIITDAGGLTSHAAIISRELKKPCIIGTKIATQVLKDGDLVEVDANNGVVKILERVEERKNVDDENKMKLQVDSFIDFIKTNNDDFFLYRGKFSPLFLWAHWYDSNEIYRYRVLMPYIAYIKNENMLMYFSQSQYEEFSKRVFQEFWNEKIDLNILRNDLSFYQEIEALYNEYINTKDFIQQKKYKELVFFLDNLKKLYKKFASRTLFIEQFDKDIILHIIGSDKRKFLDDLWDTMISAPFEHFDLRRNKLISKSLKNGINDNTVKNLRFLFVDYWIPKSFKEVKDILHDYNIDESLKNIKKQEFILKEQIKKYKDWFSNLNIEQQKMVKYTHYTMEARDIRKDILAKLHFLIYITISDFTRRTGLPKDVIPVMTINESYIDEDILKRRKDNLKERLHGVYSFSDFNGNIFLSTKNYKNVVFEIKNKIEKYHSSHNKEISGSIAYLGNIQGIVRVIIDPEKTENFHNGDILVTSMTRPEFMPFMKKAGAFITNEGGITSHAAIISRELKKPCIIGTKIATQVLKDGDLVEVDANNGVVKILEREEKKENVILSRIFSREKTLFYFTMWNDSDRMGYKDFLNHEVKNNLFIIKPKGQKGSVWYSFDELNEIEQKIKYSIKNNDSFMTLIKQRLDNEWVKLLPYLTEEKKIRTGDDLGIYYKHLITWWSAMNTIFTIPDIKDISDNIKNMILKYRSYSEKYTEQMNKLFINFWESNFPEYSDVLYFIQPQEAIKIANGKYTYRYIKKIRKRKNGCYLLNEKIILEDSFQEIIENNNIELEKYNISNKNELSGNVTYSYSKKIIASVKLISGFQDMNNFKNGEVLVTEMTNPDYLPIIKISSAIITDEGGITSHAAIISRELKKPCIIGTKIATQVLKDGDFVEVDANNGVVKILERAEDRKNLIDKFFKKIDKKDIYPFEASLSPLFIIFPWFNSSFEGIQGTSFPSLYINDKRKCYTIIPEDLYKKPGILVLKNYIESKITLNELLATYNPIYKKFSILYSKLINDDLSKKSDKYLLEIMDNIYKDYSDMIGLTLFMETLDRNILLKVLADNNLVNKILEKSTHPYFKSFEHRRYEEIISKSKKLNIDDLTNYSMYMFTDYYKPKSKKFVKSKIKEIIKSKKEFYLDSLEDFETWKKTLNYGEKRIVDYIQFVMHQRDIRKDPIAKVQYVLYLIAEEIAYRAGIEKKYIVHITGGEYLKGVQWLKDNKGNIYSRYNGQISFLDTDGHIEIQKINYSNAIKKIITKITKKADFSNKINGQTANKGKTRGVVKIILDVHDDFVFHENDILVTSMTRPEFMPFMKKAGAFITNEGGITSHAAIVAREMNKPCIIGTKIATQVLKDGDFVEVDANNGVVKILERAEDKK